MRYQSSGRGLVIPQHGMLQGPSRVLRAENPQIALVTLALETLNVHATSLIMQVFAKTMAGLSSNHFKPEFVEIDGALNINRLLEDARSNEHIFERTTNPIQLRK